jgi:hypothetical protein
MSYYRTDVKYISQFKISRIYTKKCTDYCKLFTGEKEKCYIKQDKSTYNTTSFNQLNYCSFNCKYVSLQRPEMVSVKDWMKEIFNNRYYHMISKDNNLFINSLRENHKDMAFNF